MSEATLTVSQETYQLLLERARASRRKPEDLADELLRAPAEPTAHPYVIRREGCRGGRPILRGSSIPVWLVAAIWRAGDSLEEIALAYPHLLPAAIYDAISFYLDHQEQIEEEIAENRLSRVLADTGATMDERGVITVTPS